MTHPARPLIGPAPALFLLLPGPPATANEALQALLNDNPEQIGKPSRRMVGPLIAQIAAIGDAGRCRRSWRRPWPSR
ncbi:hypothetical protein [Paracoccus salsus]|uniref:hypothetical protein n=1 Tax=Paracoccus salsus TaxID=2911061 RepID=UPI001F2E9E1D|nr:hypothetical protein [Paracoccus salsus]MCF3973121.1 hypothetical protein [Paracoccus salsus]